LAPKYKDSQVLSWIAYNSAPLAALAAYFFSMSPYLFGPNYFSGDFYHIHMPFEYAYKSLDKNVTIPTWLPYFQGGRATFGDMANSYSPIGLDFIIVYIFTKFFALDQIIGLIEINTWRVVILNIIFALGCRQFAREILDSRFSADFVFLVTLFIGGFFLPHRPIFIMCNIFSPWVLLYATKMGTRGARKFIHNATGFSLTIAASVFHQFNIQSTLIWPYLLFYFFAVWIFCFRKRFLLTILAHWRNIRARIRIIIIVGTIISAALPLAWEYNYFQKYNGKMLYPGEPIENLYNEPVYNINLITDERFEWQKLLSLFFPGPKTVGGMTNVDKGMPGFFIHNFQYMGSITGLLLIIAVAFGRNRFKVPIVIAILAYILFSTLIYFPFFSTAMRLNYPMTRHFLFTQLHLAPLIAVLAGMGMDRLLKIKAIKAPEKYLRYLFPTLILLYGIIFFIGQYMFAQGEHIQGKQEYILCLLILFASLGVLVGSLLVYKNKLRFSLVFLAILLDLTVYNKIAHKFTVNILGGDDQIIYMHAISFFKKPKDVPVFNNFSKFSPLPPDAYTVWQEPHFYFPELFRYAVIGNKSYYDVFLNSTKQNRNLISGFTLPRLMLIPNAIEDLSGEVARRILSDNSNSNLFEDVVFLSERVSSGKENLVPEGFLNLDQSRKVSISEDYGYHKILPSMITTNIEFSEGSIDDLFTQGNPRRLETKHPLAVDKNWWIQVDFGEDKIVNLVKTDHEYAFQGRPSYLEASHDLLNWKRIGYLTSSDRVDIPPHFNGWRALNNEPHRYYRIYMNKSNPVVLGKHLPNIEFGYKTRKNSSQMKTRLAVKLPLLRFKNEGLSQNKKYYIFSTYLPGNEIDLTTNPDQSFGYSFKLNWLTKRGERGKDLSPIWGNDWYGDNLFQVGYLKAGVLSVNVPASKIISNRKNMLEIDIKSLSSKINVLDYSANSLLVSVKNKRYGWLYFADTWDEYWSAKLDNKPTKVYKANLQFKAIYLPPGKHIIQFKHDPKSFWNLIYLGYFFQILNFLLWTRKKSGIKH